MAAAGGHGQGRLHAVRHHLRRLRHAPRLRLHPPGDRRGEPQRQDLLRAAGPDHGLRPEPPGDRGHRDVARHAQPDDRRSVRRAGHRAGRAAIAAHEGPVYMRLLRGKVPLVLDEIRATSSSSARPSCCATATTCWSSPRASDDARAGGRPRRSQADKVDVAVLHVPDDQAAGRDDDRPRPCATGTAWWSWPRTTR